MSQYVAEGLPVRSDGKLNREDALNWVASNHSDYTGQDRGVGRANRLARDRRQPRPAARRVPTRHGDPDVLLERLLDRVQTWREISTTYPGGARLPINLITAMYASGDRSAVLTWLRAGLPYAVEGDWETGDGFVLVSHWVMD